jgi:hypothetical protein
MDISDFTVVQAILTVHVFSCYCIEFLVLAIPISSETELKMLSLHCSFPAPVSQFGGRHIH